MSLPRRLPVLLRLLLGLGLRLLSQLRTLNEESPVLLLLLLLVDSLLGGLTVLDGLLVDSLLGVFGVLDGLLVLPWTLNRTELGVSLPEGLPLAPPLLDPEPLGPGFPPLLAPPPTLPLPLLELVLPRPRAPDPLSTCSNNERSPSVQCTLATPTNGTLAPLFPLPEPRPLDDPDPLILMGPTGSPNLQEFQT